MKHKKKSDIWTTNVNFYVAVLFIAAFGLNTTSVLLKVAELEDPITTTISVYL